MRFISLYVISFLVAFATPVVQGDDVTPIPAEKAKIEEWFKANVQPFSARKGTLDPALEAAEAEPPRIITVDQKGGGEFKTISDAIKSIPVGNTKRVVVKIAPGVYHEKVVIDVGRPFVTLLGKPGAETIIEFDGTHAKYGTMDSATLIVWSQYFIGANLIVKNLSPMPKPGAQGQALATRINGDKGAFYNCKFYGFQDTLCDDIGNHFFKDCYIEGTYDFIFGRGASIHLNSHLHAVGDGLRVIAAHNRQSNTQKNGYSFVHCKVTGIGSGIYLGRSWMSHPRVIYAYTEMSGVVNPSGWAENRLKEHDKTVFYGEYMCTGPGSNKEKRVAHTQEIDTKEAHEFLTLGYIQGSKWLLPPPSF